MIRQLAVKDIANSNKTVILMLFCLLMLLISWAVVNVLCNTKNDNKPDIILYPKELVSLKQVDLCLSSVISHERGIMYHIQEYFIYIITTKAWPKLRTYHNPPGSPT